MMTDGPLYYYHKGTGFFLLCIAHEVFKGIVLFCFFGDYGKKYSTSALQ